MLYFFFFKQKTAYEMRISDWSSDVCSSDLRDMRVGRTTVVVINRLECTQVQLQYVVGTQRVAGATDRHDPPRILESAQQRGLHDVGRGRGPTRTGIRLQLIGVWPYRNAWRIQCRVAQRPVDHQLPLHAGRISRVAAIHRGRIQLYRFAFGQAAATRERAAQQVGPGACGVALTLALTSLLMSPPHNKEKA